MEQPQLNMPIGHTQSPPASELLRLLKSTAWTCATINAATCASYPPKLYVTTAKSQPTPKCLTRPISVKSARRLADLLQVKADHAIHQVERHPLLTLIDTVNPYMNSFDLWELTTLYQETVGSCFWLLRFDMIGRPIEIWPLPAHLVGIHHDQGQFTYYFQGQNYTDADIIHFRYPDPSNPYYYGLSPLRSIYTEARIAASYAELKIARFQNRAAPDVVVSPKEPIGPDERDRLELQWNTKFRQGGAGRVLVAESEMAVELMNAQMGDIAALAEKGSNSDDICNAFHVPLSMLTTNTNLANLQASEAQHASKCIAPRLLRRDQRLTEKLLPHYDQTGRLYFASDDPRPNDPDYDFKTVESAAKYGWMTINELRDGEGLPPVPWGTVPPDPKRLGHDLPPN